MLKTNRVFPFYCLPHKISFLQITNLLQKWFHVKSFYRGGRLLLRFIYKIFVRQIKNVLHYCLAFLLKIILVFSKNITILHQINVKKCPFSIQCWDSNPRPLKHESPPITTRPWLPPNCLAFLNRTFLAWTASCSPSGPWGTGPMWTSWRSTKRFVRAASARGRKYQVRSSRHGRKGEKLARLNSWKIFLKLCIWLPIYDQL